MHRLPGRPGDLQDSHLFGPLVHSRPLRTVIEVEENVLTAAGLQGGEETEPLGQRRGGAETIPKTKKKNVCKGDSSETWGESRN